ncbi:hypothetical protein LAZ67_7002259 [Cordylochernes scorpioides]|uniref:Reverse transcriptase Ty1/copia-type domain-containing protein n=1 Tax=Cordylochernes scorpioides TaxID=51811 RepID=A0ABY6KNK1_9ARAC|nr:hypothetical protein LAZ67_7002259 [Cordylochernes scorpioides]
MRTLQQLAEDEGQNYPEASRVTLNDFYVDDLLTGDQTIAETKELIDQLKDLMKRGGFHLRKWNSNCHEIVSQVEEMNEEKKINLEKGAISKILGIVWDHVQDTFRVNITLPEEVVTKRDLLSNIARIFDPLGFLSPTTVALKIIMQELWRSGTGWDEHIPNDIKEKWNNFRAELLKLGELSIPRYVWACEKDRDVQLHGFCDASSVAYSAVCYLRTVSLDGQVHISMLAAKTRVAPCKSLTLPRLELCAALLLSQLYRSVVDSLKIDIGRAYLWSDSQISLSWIKSDPNRWKTFIHNRVVKIQQLSDRNSWRHVSGKDNPADCASRGIMPAALSGHTLWWQGPTWLKDNKFVQNQDNCYGRECHEEEKVALACQSRVSVCPEVVTKYSTFIKTRRIIAWCLRFITNCRVSLKKREIGTLSKKELENAVIRIIGWIQKDEFGEEMQDLRNTGHASRKSRILQLNPFIDASGMLRPPPTRKNVSFQKEIFVQQFHPAEAPVALKRRPGNHIREDILFHPGKIFPISLAPQNTPTSGVPESGFFIKATLDRVAKALEQVHKAQKQEAILKMKKKQMKKAFHHKKILESASEIEEMEFDEASSPFKIQQVMDPTTHSLRNISKSKQRRNVMSLQSTLDKGFEMKMDKKDCKLFKTTTGEVIVEGKDYQEACMINKELSSNQIDEQNDTQDIGKIESNVQTSDVYNLRDRSNISNPQRYIDAEINIAKGLEPKTHKEAKDSPNAQFWKESMNEEMNSLTENDVYECTTLPPGQNPIDCKWVLKTKLNSKGEITRYKARLVAKGFVQKKGIDYEETFSPVARHDTIRALLAIAANEDLKLVQFDIKTAFLRG